MAETLMFDTTFLIDFQRERRAPGAQGPAHAFLQSDPGISMELSAIALGEFGEGFAEGRHPLLQWVASRFRIVPIDAETSHHYSRIVRSLRARGQLIGANDFWIAAAALRHKRRLVTRNTQEFARVDELAVCGY